MVGNTGEILGAGSVDYSAGKAALSAASVAGVVPFLASDLAGAVIDGDGGLSAQVYRNATPGTNRTVAGWPAALRFSHG